MKTTEVRCGRSPPWAARLITLPVCARHALTCGPQTRARRQRDVVYRRGQVVATKALVILVIDDSDRAASPHGYVEHAQKTVMINRWRVSLPLPTLFLCPVLPDERR
jgi:hypothetical protein